MTVLVTLGLVYICFSFNNYISVLKGLSFALLVATADGSVGCLPAEVILLG